MNRLTLSMIAPLLLLGGVTQASAYTLSLANISNPGNGVPLVLSGPGGEQVTFSYTDLSGNGPSQFESFNSNGMDFLIPGGGRSDPVTISFSKPLTSLSFLSSAGQSGNFTTTAEFFSGATSLDTQSASYSTPPFLASSFSFSGPITSVVVTTSGMQSLGFPYNSSFADISYALTSVPLPASAPMFGAALMALGAVGYGLKRRAKAAA